MQYNFTKEDYTCGHTSESFKLFFKIWFSFHMLLLHKNSERKKLYT